MQYDFTVESRYLVLKSNYVVKLNQFDTCLALWKALSSYLKSVKIICRTYMKI